jgi:hypothetical protein
MGYSITVKGKGRRFEALANRLWMDKDYAKWVMAECRRRGNVSAEEKEARRIREKGDPVKWYDKYTSNAPARNARPPIDSEASWI